MAFVEHPLFRLPPGDTKIWRYMDFTKLVSLLDTRKLYFSNIERLSEFDPFEGLYTRRNLENEIILQRLSYDEMPEEMRKAFPNKAAFEVNQKVLPSMREVGKRQRRITYVNCWHESQYESAAMWKAYLKSDEGIAIQSTVDRLKESIRADQAFEINIGQVHYVDFDDFAIPGYHYLLQPFLYKRQSFEYEHELRALIWGGQHGKIRYDNPEKSPPSGLSIATDLDILVERIYASPRAESWFVQLLSSICAHYNLEKPVVQSDLASKLY